MTDHPTPLQVFTPKRDHILSRILDGGERRVRIAWTPELPSVGQMSLPTDQVVISATVFVFESLVTRVRDRRMDNETHILTIRESVSGEIVEMRPMSYSELTRLANQVYRGYRD